MPNYNSNSGHKAIKGSRSLKRYTVYDNRDDWPLIVDGTPQECAKAMGVTQDSFYNYVARCRKGKCKTWTILSRYADGTPDRLHPQENYDDGEIWD